MVPPTSAARGAPPTRLFDPDVHYLAADYPTARARMEATCISCQVRARRWDWATHSHCHVAGHTVATIGVGLVLTPKN